MEQYLDFVLENILNLSCRDMKNFIKAALSLRNLIIFLLGGVAMIIFLLIVQLIISKSLEGFWDDDLIFPFLIGGAAALLRYEKPFFNKWERLELSGLYYILVFGSRQLMSLFMGF